LTWAQLNAEFVAAIRWWTLEELVAAEEAFAPRALPSLVTAIARDGPSATPFDVGV
jgi:hypothetical protein